MLYDIQDPHGMKAQGGKTSDHIQVTTTGLVINANIGRWRHLYSQ
ncbi:MAG: hypothetical protein WCF03_12765 [Nitrososphaeraceae archaeon]